MEVTRTYFWSDNQQNNANVDVKVMLDEYLHSATNESDIVNSFADMLRRMVETEVYTGRRYYDHMIDNSRADGKQLRQNCLTHWLKVNQRAQESFEALYNAIDSKKEKESIMSLIKGIYIDKAEDRIAKIKNSKKYKESDNEDFKAKLLEKAGTYNRVTVVFKDGRVGTADCDPQDTFDPFVGFCIATCKALAGTAGDLYRLYRSKLNK